LWRSEPTIDKRKSDVGKHVPWRLAVRLDPRAISKGFYRIGFDHAKNDVVDIDLSPMH
jgi:hypothetical protein